MTYLLDEPLLIAGEERDEIGVKHYCFDPSLAPAGKSAVDRDAAHQLRLLAAHLRTALYDTEQIQVADMVIDFLEGIYPGIREQIEVMDVATPLSYERYTGNWQGSTCGWLLTKRR